MLGLALTWAWQGHALGRRTWDRCRCGTEDHPRKYHDRRHPARLWSLGPVLRPVPVRRCALHGCGSPVAAGRQFQHLARVHPAADAKTGSWPDL